jgi:hypothetical protein
MPNPISRVAPGASIIINNNRDYPLRRNEHLARLAMEGISSWATVESFMLKFYIALAGGVESAAADIFLALENNSAKLAALGALLKRTDERYRKLYEAIARLIKSRKKARDKLAHWVWGTSPHLPDALLLADPRIIANIDHNTDFRDAVFVYREKDFLDIISANERLASYGHSLHWIIKGHIANESDRLYGQLCAEPEIQEMLKS